MTQDSQKGDGTAQPADHELKNQGDKLQSVVDKAAGSKPPDDRGEAAKNPPGS